MVDVVEFVADAPHGYDVFRFFRVLLDDFAQAADVDVDGSGGYE